MLRIVVAVLLLSTPAMAQSNPYTGGKSDPYMKDDPNNQMPPPAPGAIKEINCEPTGKTARGELVYALSCRDIPVAGTYPAGEDKK